MKYDVCFAQIHDVEKASEFVLGFREELGFVSRVKLLGSQAKGELILVFSDQEIVGLLCFHFRRDQQITIYNICVHPCHQRRGIGTTMFGFLLDAGKQLGCKCVRLKCPVDLVAANAFYIKLGFNQVQVLSGKYRRLNMYDLAVDHNQTTLF